MSLSVEFAKKGNGLRGIYTIRRAAEKFAFGILARQHNAPYLSQLVKPLRKLSQLVKPLRKLSQRVKPLRKLSRCVLWACQTTK